MILSTSTRLGARGSIGTQNSTPIGRPAESDTTALGGVAVRSSSNVRLG